MAETKSTADHEVIRRFAEDRGGKPAIVAGTGIIRLNFPGFAEENLEDISWEDWFEEFENNNLALVYQEKTSEGEESNFNKLVDRSSIEPNQ